MSKAAVRHAWMFRTAAFVFLVFGALWIWRFGFTDYHPEQRPWGLGAGAAALLVAFHLFRLKRFAIGASAAGPAHRTPHFLRFSPAGSPLTLTLFPDGRALVHGTSDPATARSLYARYIGS